MWQVTQASRTVGEARTHMSVLGMEPLRTGAPRVRMLKVTSTTASEH